MKKPFHCLIAAAMVAVCFSFGGCTLATWARIFNRTDHEIVVFRSNQDKIIIAPGSNATIALWAASKSEQRGFVILDRGQEHFFAMIPERKDYPIGSQFLPRESGKRRPNGLEYFFEYGGASELFALIPSDEESPKRAAPQPPGFPLKPNQSPEPTSGLAPGRGSS